MKIIDKIVRSRNKRVPRVVTVKSAQNLTPNMRRVTLHGKDLAGFPVDAEGAYIKLVFDDATNPKPVIRTYTVAQQRTDLNEMDVDFMLHGSDDGLTNGIAARWSVNAEPGDEITLMGPGPAQFINLDAQCFLLAADMTALPAMIANLNRLPENAVGKVFVEIISEADKQEIPMPEGLQLQWVINDEPGSDSSPLFHAIQQSERQQGKLAAWVACEFVTMRKIRQHLREDLGVEKSQLYVSSYWKKGASEEQHKVVKQNDAKLAANNAA